MEKIALVKIIAMVVALFAGVFLPIFAAWFVKKHGKEQDYLRRVARKYSIPPLDLRG